jgi:hypothetical protein
MNKYLRHLRRWFLIIFRPYYVMASLSQRRGNCKGCGCCYKNFKCYDYPHCKRWNNLPFICKLYPIDEKDKNEISKKCCGFYWTKK